MEDLTQPLPRRFAFGAAVGLYAVCFTILAWPWLSGTVTIPWDAKAQFYPQLRFLARSLAEGQSPFWSPNIFAGWPQIADPQSLIFSPFHVLLAYFDPSPSFRAADAVTFAQLFIGGFGILLMFRERGWHIAGALVAALGFVFGCSNAARLQHIIPVESLAYLPLALWLLMRTLERSSWRAGIAAGVATALIAIGRDQVALLELYVLAGFVLWHWLDGDGRLARIRVSFWPLAGMLWTTALLVAVPVILTMLLADDSNRPEIAYDAAGRGSLHPAHLLMLVFADLFGASDPNVAFWGPPSVAWREALGRTDLFLAQNMGQVYAGALVVVALVSFGVMRGLAWTREIRFFSVATVLVLLYALGWYTPVFHVMYDVLPGVDQFRRPAGATFVFGALIAIIAGYLIHHWLTAKPQSPTLPQRAFEIGAAVIVVTIAVALAYTAGTQRAAAVPILTGIACVAGAIAVLALARRVSPRHPLVAAIVLAAFATIDLGWNNAPSESTGLPPATYEALRQDTDSETVALLKSRIATTAAPDRRDRVELIGIAYHWPNLSLVHDFDHLFGQNPLRLADFEQATGAGDTVATPDQRKFTALFPSYRSVMADLFGIRYIATGVPVEQIDPSLKPDDLIFVKRTRSAYVYENPRALPRVMVASAWQIADFDDMIKTGVWPDIDPRHTVLLEEAPQGVTQHLSGGTARIARYHNTEIIIDADTPSGGILVLNDIWHPWWQATVDGVPAEILKANVVFRAVVLGPGKHKVRFEFHPIAGAIAEISKKLTSSDP